LKKKKRGHGWIVARSKQAPRDSKGAQEMPRETSVYGDLFDLQREQNTKLLNVLVDDYPKKLIEELRLVRDTSGIDASTQTQLDQCMHSCV
jgi:hypothetical protein